jgi:hypothetical protein
MPIALKFDLTSHTDEDEDFTKFLLCRFCDFEVCHHSLQTNSRTLQSRLRKRGRKGKWSYMHTIRKQVSGTESYFTFQI